MSDMGIFRQLRELLWVLLFEVTPLPFSTQAATRTLGNPAPRSDGRFGGVLKRSPSPPFPNR